MDTLPAPAFVTLAAWSVVLLVIHVMTQGFTATRERGGKWNAGPRDSSAAPLGVLAGRAERASANFRETYPGFLALCLGLAVTGDASGWGMAGALAWFAARIAYLPVYLAGVPGVRSVIWLVSLAGMAVMFATIVL